MQRRCGCLSVGEDNDEGYAQLSDLEKEREMKCLCLQVEHVPSKTMLARVTSWRAASMSITKWSETNGFEGHVERDRYHEKIHIHCQQRQHESMSRKIMEACQREASTRSDRWMINGAGETVSSTKEMGKNGNRIDDRNGNGNDKVWSSEQIWAAVATERVSETLDVTALNRGRVEIMLTGSLVLTLSLQPIHSIEIVENNIALGSEEALALNTALTRALLQCEKRFVAHLRQGVLTISALENKEETANALENVPDAASLTLLRTMCQYIGEVGLLKGTT